MFVTFKKDYLGHKADAMLDILEEPVAKSLLEQGVVEAVKGDLLRPAALGDRAISFILEPRRYNEDEGNHPRAKIIMRLMSKARRAARVLRNKAAAMAALRKADLRLLSIDDLKTLLGPLFKGYSVQAPIFDPGVPLFRIRVWQKPSFLREVSYPDANNTRLGRANRPASPVLYCSSVRESPFFEARPEVGKTATIIHWVTTARLTVNHVGYTPSVFSALKSNRPHAGWAGQRAAVPGDQINAQINDFLAEAFACAVPPGEEYRYNLSVAIAEGLSCDGVFDGLLYPSIAMRANADNFAIQTKYADQNLRFVKAEFIRIDAIREFAYDITIFDTATEIGKDGSIHWTARPWTIPPKGQLVFRFEEKWVARDTEGRIVEPD
jgi:hypothetical protein